MLKTEKAFCDKKERRKEMGYIKDSYKELVEKVSWPSFSSLQSSTLVVMVASLIFALIVLAMDMSFDGLMSAIYKFLGNL